MRATASLAIVVAGLLAGAAALWASSQELDKTLRRYEKDRAKLAAEINELRAEEGLGPLSPEARLTRAAQEVALAIGGRMKAHAKFEDAIRDGELEERLAAAGYETHAFAVRFAVISSDALDVAARLVADRDELLRSDLPQLGIGMAPSWRSRIYVVVAALSAGDHFAAETADADDLEEARARLVDLVNRARLESNQDPLRRDDCLAGVAQAHAERVLGGGAGGGELADRVRAGGCPHRTLGQTMARGQARAEEVVEEWLASAEHRRILLDSDFDAAGLGLAKGRGPDGYVTVWVQVLGGNASATP